MPQTEPFPPLDPGTLPTIGALLRARAERTPERRAFTFLGDGRDESDQRSYRELDRRAGAIAQRVLELGLTRQPVLLLLRPGLTFIDAFFGCLYAGALAVPLIPPAATRLKSALPRLKAVVAQAGARAVLCDAALAQSLDAIEEHAPELAALRWIRADEVSASGERSMPIPEPDPAAIAFLQYTSGSTGSPKGVIVSHGNIVHNLIRLRDCLELDCDSTIVGWTPFEHDLGLIANMLLPVFCGALGVEMPPTAFIKHPMRWLEAISRYRAVMSGGPNFAYEMIRRRATGDQLEALDLSAWTRAFVSAEPIVEDTLRGFASLLEPTGFRWQSLTPAYGLAESTLMVATKPFGAAPVTASFDAAALARGEVRSAPTGSEGSRSLVSSGRPARDDQALAIVDPQTRRRCKPAEVGEIWMSSASVAAGYWRDPDTTEHVFGAQIEGAENGRFARTGDLGFLLDDQLFIAGRAKDMIIVDGTNHHAHDIEATVTRAHPVLAPDGACAFAFNVGGHERIAVVAELDRRARPSRDPQLLEDVIKAIRREVGEAHGIGVHRVVLVKGGVVPKTSSGKVRRFLCREQLHEGVLPVLSSSWPEAEAPGTPALQREVAIDTRTGSPATADAAVASTLAALRNELAKLLRTTPAQVDPGSSLLELGLSSLSAVELQGWVEERFGVASSMTRLLQTKTVRDLAALIADGRTSAGTNAAVLVGAPQQRYEPFPLTDIQTAYYLGRDARFELGGVGIHGYVEVSCVRLDVDRLERAWQRVVERHDMLRCVVLPDGRQQVVQTVEPYAFARADLRMLDRAARERALQAIRDVMSHRQYTCHEWRNFEIGVSQLGDDEYLLHVGIDANHVDYWSISKLYADWFTIYDGREHELADLPISYRDYCLAVEQAKQQPAYGRSREYWRNRVADLRPAPMLPLTKPLAAIEEPRFDRHELLLDPDTWRRLKVNASAAGVTPSTLLLAVYARILGTWSEDPKFTLNVTLADRQRLHPAVKELVGNFTSMLLLEVDDTVGPDFATYAQTIQTRLLADLEHRQASGIPVLKEIARLRKQPFAALYPVVFTSTLGASGPQALAGFGTPGFTVSMTPQVMLDAQMLETESGALHLSWDVVRGLLPEGVVEDMFEAQTGYLRRLANQDAWSSALESLVPARQLDRRALVNATGEPIGDALLDELFEGHVASHPERPAVICSSTSLSYAELDNVANHFAAQLRSAGVTRGSVVPVVMEKGWEQVAAVLAVLKTGAAYMPVDAALPAHRRALLLRDAGSDVVLTQPWIDERLPWPEGLTRIRVSDAQRRLLLDTTRVPHRQPGDLAYVLHTSGTTGVPKGVMIRHESVVVRMRDVVERFGLGPDDRAIGLTSLSHDLSVFDIFGMLAIAGGALVVPAASEIRDPERWLELLRAHRVSVWNSVPTFMTMLVTYGEHAPPGQDARDSLRLVILSGDFIPVALPDRIRAHFPQALVISAGGPTETTVWDICFPVDRIDPAWKSIPYGRPMAGARYHVLHADMRDCPEWAVGELFIEGTGLATGYWNDEVKTRARFVTHPRSGQRMYASGDRGRYLPDGDIEILGRRDALIKLHGNRIEPGDVEAAFHTHPGVGRAHVCVSVEGGRSALVAYVVPRKERAVDVVAQDRGARMLLKLEDPWAHAPAPGRADVALAGPGDDAATRARFLRRRTSRRFSSRSATAEQLGQLLACLAPIDIDGRPHRKYRYPSAGSLYPVQVHVAVAGDRVSGIAPGIYYYHPGTRALIAVGPGVQITAGCHSPDNQPIHADAAFSIFLVGDVERVALLYGDRARDFCLLEAGYMGQLLMSEAAALDLGLCPIGGVDESSLRALLDIGSKALVHSMLGGVIDAADDSYVWATPRRSPAPAVHDLSQQLREHVAAQLPEIMVPTHIVVLDALPLGPNGKVDQAALPSPEASLARTSAPFAAPASELEQTIAATWAKVLGTDRIDVHVGFFEHGGDSVQLVEVHRLLVAALAIELHVRDLLQYPTVAALARHASGTTDDAAGARAGQRAQARLGARARRLGE